MKKIFCVVISVLLLFAPASGLASGSVRADEQAVKKILNHYFDLRYGMLSKLVFNKDICGLLSPAALSSKDVMNEADVLETIIAYRKAQTNDLRFDKYKYSIDYNGIDIDNGKSKVTLDENYELYYNCAPTVRVKGVIGHVLTLELSKGGWLILNDDYSDADGVKKLLTGYFTGKDISKEEAERLVLNQPDILDKERIARLESLFATKESRKLAVLYKGKRYAYFSGEAVKIGGKGAPGPVDAGGEILLPARYICERSGAAVSWDKADNSVRIVFNGHEAVFRIGGSVLKLDGADIAMKKPIRTVDGSTMLPAGIIAAVLGKCAYIGDNGLVILSDREFNTDENKTLIGNLTGFYDSLFSKADFPRIDGSTATYPLSIEMGKKLLGLDDTGAKGFITHKTTHNAYVNLIDGNADIIFVTPPSQDEYDLAKKKGVEMEVVPVCREGFVFLVNVRNPVNGLSVKQVQDIYRGLIKNWKEVGGEDLGIVPYQREPNSGSQTLMESVVMKGLKMTVPPKEYLIYGMGELVDRVADYSNARNALGYSVYYYITQMYSSRSIKLLSINGVVPAKSTIRDGAYPFTISYYAVIRKDEPENGSARRLLGWLLGPEGQGIVDKAGFVPLIFK